MKTREEMVNEIVGEFEKKWWTEWMSGTILDGDEIVIDSEKVKSFLRTALLKISDASMDAVETVVEEKYMTTEMEIFKETFPILRLYIGEGSGGQLTVNEYVFSAISRALSFARTASQEKRKEWTKV